MYELMVILTLFSSLKIEQKQKWIVNLQSLGMRVQNESQLIALNELQYMSNPNRKESVCILKPFKIVNPRELRQNCQICSSKFQILLNVQHQCKRCYRVICEKCSQNKIKIYHPQGHSSVHKCCTPCMKEENAIDAFIKQNKLVFAGSSRFADEWIKKLRKENISSKEKSSEEKSSTVSISSEFNEKLYQVNNNTIRFKSQSSRILNELCASQHFSLRQFTGRMIQNVSTDNFQDTIIQTMTAIYGYLSGLPYTNELVYVVLFLLCFCSRFECYFIVTRYIQKIFPQFQRIDKLKKDNLLTHELKMLLDMYKILNKKSDKEELDRVTKLLQKDFFLTCVKSLLINVASVTISFFVIDELLKNTTYITLYKSITALVYLSRELLFQDSNDPGYVSFEYYVLRSITVDQLKSSLIVFQKSNVKFEMDHQFFDSIEHRKLHEKYKQLESTYQKSEERYRILDSNHHVIKKQYQQILLKFEELKQENMTLNEEMIKNAEKFINSQDIEKYKQENKKLKDRNDFFTKENINLRAQIQELKKQEMVGATEKAVFERIKKDYQREMVDLKTKNEIFEIERQANNISFNTSFIEQKLEEKNMQIASLISENNKLKMELEFSYNYRVNNMPPKEESIFMTNMSSIQQKQSFIGANYTNNNSLNLTGFQIAPKQQKDNFKKFIEMGKKVNESLKSDLARSEKRRLQLQTEVKELRETVSKLEKHLQLNEEINNFINQIPEQIQYSDSVEELENLISKETNIHKKGKLETVLSSFRKCLYEVRYRAIDAKLKQNKIKQLYSNPNEAINQSNNSNHLNGKAEIQMNQIIDINEALDWIGNESELAQINRSSIKNEQCNIM